jgi:hypothetical protein
MMGLSLGGCTQPSYTQAQLTAIETREVEADFRRSYDAASAALFDSGYMLVMSDFAGGLLTGEKQTDRTAARIWLNSAAKNTIYITSVHVRQVSAGRCAVRIKMSINGVSQVDKEEVDRLWVLMQRQVLMKSPAAPGTGEPG